MTAGVNEGSRERTGLSAARTVLVLGGARSGKSRFAEGLLEGEPDRLYVATGQSFDEEMRVRIEAHRSARGAGWRTMEEPVGLAGALRASGAPALVDCLTLWLSNLILGGHAVGAAMEELEAALGSRAGRTVLVSNEVGMGIVPGDALSRRFRDEAGIMNQRVAGVADAVVMVAAGLPMRLK